jgi:energy-coupling factor transporter transmembrane protein EcfT
MRRPATPNHPWVYPVLFLTWSAVSVALQNLWLLLALLAGAITVLLVGGTPSRGTYRSMMWTVRITLPFVCLYALVSIGYASAHPLVPPVWLTISRVPLLGTLVVTKRGLDVGCTEALHWFDVLVIFWAISGQVSADDIQHWLGRRFARAGLSLAMVLHFVPELLAERERVLDWMTVRRRNLAHQASSSRLVRWRRELQMQKTLYRVLLTNALERAWQLAETMTVRGYGSARKTRYTLVRWRPYDGWLCVLCVLALTGVVLPALSGLGVGFIISVAVIVRWRWRSSLEWSLQ